MYVQRIIRKTQFLCDNLEKYVIYMEKSFLCSVSDYNILDSEWRGIVIA